MNQPISSATIHVSKLASNLTIVYTWGVVVTCETMPHEAGD